MYHSFLIHAFTDVHLGCFQHLAIVSNTAMNIGVHRFFSIGDSGFLGYIPSTRIMGSKGSSIFSFMRKIHTIFHSDCTSLHTHPQYTRVPFSLHPQQHLFIHLLVMAILTGVRSLYGFNLHLSDGQWCWASFHTSMGHLNVLLGEVSIQVLCTFF